jgi:hypothetical protein
LLSSAAGSPEVTQLVWVADMPPGPAAGSGAFAGNWTPGGSCAPPGMLGIWVVTVYSHLPGLMPSAPAAGSAAAGKTSTRTPARSFFTSIPSVSFVRCC